MIVGFRLGNYVENTANGDESVILSAGMRTKTISNFSSQIPARPKNLKVSFASREGEIELRWKKTASAKSYVIQKNSDPFSNWEYVAVVTKTKYIAGELPGLVKFWFRVATIGSAGQSDWSDPVMGMAR